MIAPAMQALRAMEGATDAQRAELIEAIEAMMDEPRKLLSPAEVARRRGAGKQTVIESIRSGRLRASVIIGADTGRPAMGVTPSEADEWSPMPVGQPTKKE